MSEKVESPKITFNYKGKDYCLCVTPHTLEVMEKGGTRFSELAEMVVTGFETMFYGTFIENHPQVSNATKKEIYNGLKRKADNFDLKETVQDMYLTAFAELQGKDEGEIEWTVTGG